MMRITPKIRITSHKGGEFQMKLREYSDNDAIFSKIFDKLEADGYYAVLESGKVYNGFSIPTVYNMLYVYSKPEQTEEALRSYGAELVDIIRNLTRGRNNERQKQQQQ